MLNRPPCNKHTGLLNKPTSQGRYESYGVPLCSYLVCWPDSAAWFTSRMQRATGVTLQPPSPLLHPQAV